MSRGDRAWKWFLEAGFWNKSTCHTVFAVPRLSCAELEEFP